MFKSITLVALVCLASSASAGLIETHHVVQEPVLTKIGSVVHSSPSAVSHQSFTRVHNKAVVSPIVAPVVKTTLHAAPITNTLHTYDAAPAVHTYAAAPALHTTYAAAPVVHSAPIVHSAQVVNSPRVVHSSHDLYSNHIVHSGPVLKTLAPAAYTLHHH